MSPNTTPNLQIPATLRPSRVKWASLFLLCSVFVLGGIWMVREGESSGYFVAGFFAIGLPVAAIQLLPGAAYLRLTQDGFTFCSLFRAQTIRWTQVSEFAVVRVHIWMVAWNFTTDYPPGGRARSLSRLICGCEAALPDTYGMRPRELLVLMESLRQKFS